MLAFTPSGSFGPPFDVCVDEVLLVGVAHRL